MRSTHRLRAQRREQLLLGNERLTDLHAVHHLSEGRTPAAQLRRPSVDFEIGSSEIETTSWGGTDLEFHPQLIRQRFERSGLIGGSLSCRSIRRCRRLLSR